MHPVLIVYNKLSYHVVINKLECQLCACAKVFELLVYEPLLASVSNYISPAQHGFTPKRSTTSNLMEFVSICHTALDSGIQVDAIYTDITAAFDWIPHSILLKKGYIGAPQLDHAIGCDLILVIALTL